jgi:non-heme chloroperoxidase
MSTHVADDGVRLGVTVHGDATGRPVVLLAGFKAPATSWRYQGGPLVAAGYRVLLVDLRGHGTADRPASVDMDRRGHDVEFVLGALDLHGAVLVGASMGASTAWSHVAQTGAPRVSAIVSVDQTPRMLSSAEWPHGFYGYDETTADTLFAEGIPDTGRGTPLWRRGMRLVRLLRAMRGAERELSPGELALLGDHARRDWRSTVAAARLPVLFVAGADSEFWPAAHAAAAAGLTARGESVVLPRDGHAANIEQPRAFNRALLDFLGRVAPAAG